MLGTIRFTLAVLVLLNHLWGPIANLVGTHAVLAFFTISGFLMTKVIHEVYGLSLEGGLRYLFNRALRIYPPYLAVLAAALTLQAAVPTSSIYTLIKLPETWGQFVQNITLFNLTWSPVIVIPPAWSLWIEVVFYVAMVALLARSRTAVLVWLVASIAIHFTLLLHDAGRHYSLFGVSIYFSIGSALYFYRDRLEWLTPSPLITAILFAVFCPLPLIVGVFGITAANAGMYICAPLFVPILLGALSLRPVLTYDRQLGDYAYPIFITHFFAGCVVHWIVPNVTPFSTPFLVLSTALCLAISFVIILAGRYTIDRVRNDVRGHDFHAVVPSTTSNIRSASRSEP